MPALLHAAAEQNHKPVAVPSEVNSVAGAKVNLIFENAVTDRFDVGQVAFGNAFKRRCSLRCGLNVERT